MVSIKIAVKSSKHSHRVHGDDNVERAGGLFQRPGKCKRGVVLFRISYYDDTRICYDFRHEGSCWR